MLNRKQSKIASRLTKKQGNLIGDKKGVAGLNIFLSLVTMLFVIGLLVMVYALAGGELRGALASDQNTSKDVINDTVTALRDVPKDWFSTFITLGAMVVLVLLVVVIIQAIRGSGLMGGGA